MNDRIISPGFGEEDVQETSLRPRRLDDYIGQDQIKSNLRIQLEAAQLRGEALDHVLLYGPPGLGKTSLSLIIATEMGVELRMTSGPALEHAGDLASILTALEERRRPLHRRDPPPQPRRRGAPLLGDGRLRARHHHRQGPVGAERAPTAQAFHAGRRDDPYSAR